MIHLSEATTEQKNQAYEQLKLHRYGTSTDIKWVKANTSHTRYNLVAAGVRVGWADRNTNGTWSATTLNCRKAAQPIQSNLPTRNEAGEELAQHIYMNSNILF